MRRALLALVALLLALAPAAASEGPTGSALVSVNGKAGNRFSLAPLASSGVRKSDFLNALDAATPGTSMAARVNMTCPSPACTELLYGPFVEPATRSSHGFRAPR